MHALVFRGDYPYVARLTWRFRLTPLLFGLNLFFSPVESCSTDFHRFVYLFASEYTSGKFFSNLHLCDFRFLTDRSDLVYVV